MHYSGCRLLKTAHRFGTAVRHPNLVWSKSQPTPQTCGFCGVYKPSLNVKEEWIFKTQSIVGISPRKRAVACHGKVLLTDLGSFVAIFNLDVDH